MTERTISLSIIVSTIATCLVLLGWWMLTDPVKDFTEFVPGLDNRPERSRTATGEINIGGFFNWFGAEPSGIRGSWPRFRGSRYDNIYREPVRLADSWGESGPDVVWSIDLGEGHAGPVVSDGRVYVMDYDEENRRDLLRCFSFDSGKEIWQRGYDIFIKRNHGMSRTVPAVGNGYVVSIGPMCQVMCVTADSGTFKWGIDLEREYEAEIPLWYTGQCPLIDDSLAVIAVGGKALMIGINCETGKVAWQTPNTAGLKMSHASVIPMTFFGKRVYVYSAVGGIVGISSEKESRGQILFESKAWNHSVVAPSAVKTGDNQIFLTAGYGAGSMRLEVIQEAGQLSVRPLQSIKPNEGLASEQQTPIFYQDHLYAILPKDAGALRNQFVCSNPEDPQKIVWSSGKTNRFGLGPYLMADHKFYILSDEGVLTVIRASTRSYEPVSQVRILDGYDAWGPMALVGGRLLARDSRKMVCLDIRAK